MILGFNGLTAAMSKGSGNGTVCSWRVVVVLSLIVVVRSESNFSLQ